MRDVKQTPSADASQVEFLSFFLLLTHGSAQSFNPLSASCISISLDIAALIRPLARTTSLADLPSMKP